MIGVVTASLKPTLQVVVIGSGGQLRAIEATVDTGFTGFLTLPPGLIALLGLVLLGQHQGLLADGSVSRFNVYRGEILWDGLRRTVNIDEMDHDPLLGTALLQDHEIRIRMVPGGMVEVVMIP